MTYKNVLLCLRPIFAVKCLILIHSQSCNDKGLQMEVLQASAQTKQMLLSEAELAVSNYVMECK